MQSNAGKSYTHTQMFTGETTAVILTQIQANSKYCLH